jgi:hypothetical protein
MLSSSDWNMSWGKLLQAAIKIFLLWFALLSGTLAIATGVDHRHAQDPHYTSAGFFDIHVCDWPDQPLFYMPLFSTTHYDGVRSITVRYPNGRVLTHLNLDRYKILHPKGKPEKHVFMQHVDIPPGATNGWYEAEISLNSGETLKARDYVEIIKMPQPDGMQPPDGAEDIDIPHELTWKAVDGAGFYKVFIHDIWNDDRPIYTSKLLTEPRLELPANLLQPGGYYRWIVHARDVNEDIRLGDFDSGSMSRPSTFSLRP